MSSTDTILKDAIVDYMREPSRVTQTAYFKALSDYERERNKARNACYMAFPQPPNNAPTELARALHWATEPRKRLL